MIGFEGILACSGPGTQELMVINDRFGTVSLAGCILFTLYFAYLFIKERKWFWMAIVSAILIPIHPRFYRDSIHGDCGNILAEVSFLFIGINVALIIMKWVTESKKAKAMAIAEEAANA